MLSGIPSRQARYSSCRQEGTLANPIRRVETVPRADRIVLLVAIRFIEGWIDDRVAGTETVILRQVQALREQLAAAQEQSGAPAAGELQQILESFGSAARTPGAEIGFANSGDWGRWSDPRFCPAGQYVCGMRQKVERDQGNGDDSAMNAIAFYCCPLAPGAQVEAEPGER